MSDLTCHCGAGPFLTLQRLASHRTRHETVVCETCGDSIGRTGIGSHRRKHRLQADALAQQSAEQHEAELAVAEHERQLTGLRDLTPPQLGADALERAAELLDKHPDHRGCFIVAGATYGPHLTSRQNVGGVITKAGEPCLVIDLDLLAAPVVEQPTAAGRWR